MMTKLPLLFKGVPKYAYSEKRTKRELNEICLYFSNILPEEYKECLVYAFILVGRGFQHDVFINAKSAKR